MFHLLVMRMPKTDKRCKLRNFNKLISPQKGNILFSTEMKEIKVRTKLINVDSRREPSRSSSLLGYEIIQKTFA